MDINAFMEQITEGIMHFCGDRVTITTQTVVKNNGKLCHGLTFMEEGINVYPTIYIDEQYEAFMAGTKLKAIVYQLIQLYEDSKIKEPIDFSFFHEFELMKERIAYKLINREENEELLTHIPHIPFLDLAIVFYCYLQTKPFENASILIREEHCKLWNVSEKELYIEAKRNTEKLLPGEIRNMQEVIFDLLQGENKESMPEIDLSNESMPMYVLTNKNRINGASCILYQDILKDFAACIKEDLFILPSSIHEVILIPARENDDTKRLEDMVREVNANEIDVEEVLSNSVYHYSRKQEKIRLCVNA